MKSRVHPLLLLAFGVLTFGLAGLSIGDMFVARPYDGVVLAADQPRRLIVHEVIPGSGADLAGIRSGDEIAGIGREALTDAEHAAKVRNRYRIGDEVPYLVRSQGRLKELPVRLGRWRLGGGTYFYICLLGFSFFFIGLFVLFRQPTKRASQVFFLLCGLFLLFFICRLRPPSFSGIDTFVLRVGTLALLFLPPAFLHFYLLFPRPLWLRAAGEGKAKGGILALLWGWTWPLFYGLPVLAYLAALGLASLQSRSPLLTFGVPRANWWLLVLYILAGLVALAANGRRLGSGPERRGLLLVLVGSLFGLLPFLLATLVLELPLASRSFFLLGLLPLALVPLTFTYAIVRFQLLEIRIILRRSLLYTLTSALVTGVYAGLIATFDFLFSGSRPRSPWLSPLLLVLAIVLLFEPLRKRLQGPVDRFFFAGRARLQQAMVELGEAMGGQVDPKAVVQELMERLPRLLNLDFAGLYLMQGYRLVRVAGPESLPEELPLVADLQHYLQRRAAITRVGQLGTLSLRSREVGDLVDELQTAGVEAVGNLASSRRFLGMVLLSAKTSRIHLEREELDLLQGLLQQAALALETSQLLEERTQQAELERELEIAATVQEQLLPKSLEFAPGWSVSAACLPARVVGGDFYAQLPGTQGPAVIYGDVSGKSVSGALMMMAAHEALHALALTRPQPDELFRLTNRRLYSLGKRSFVALAYLSAVGQQGEKLRYLLAGQPPPLLRSSDGGVRELPMPEQRLPLGAMADTEYPYLEVPVAPGELVLGYSDGVTDARSPGGDSFGTARLRALVEGSTEGPEALIQTILETLDEFTRGGLQYDDVTLVAVGRQEEARA